MNDDIVTELPGQADQVHQAVPVILTKEGDNFVVHAYTSDGEKLLAGMAASHARVALVVINSAEANRSPLVGQIRYTGAPK